MRAVTRLTRDQEIAAIQIALLGLDYIEENFNEEWTEAQADDMTADLEKAHYWLHEQLRKL